MRRKIGICIAILLSAVTTGVFVISSASAGTTATTPLDSTTLTKFMDPLPIPATLTGANITVRMTQFQQQLHSQLPPTTVWGFNGSYPGPTIEAVRGIPIMVTWVNNLPYTHLLSASLDHTISGAGTDVPDVRTVVHLHGGEVPPQFDGYPELWITPDPNYPAKQVPSIPGLPPLMRPAGNSVTYVYPNTQLPTTLWYHDHALAITRLNVYAGLAGFYILRDPGNVEKPFAASLPSGPYEIPLVIQDRSFNSDGSLWYPTVGTAKLHPIWAEEFFGNAILVNGKVWPYLDVEARKYRFRLLNGSTSRFYNLSFSMANVVDRPVMYQIGTDGGYISAPEPVSEVLIGPAERVDLIIDFTDIAPGSELILTNDAKTPFPHGEPVDPSTTGQVMKFRVKSLASTDPDLPAALVATPALSQSGAVDRRVFIKMGGGNHDMVTLNNLPFSAAVTETPQIGGTEIWEISNWSSHTHPIHLHLVQFQVIEQKPFKLAKFKKDWADLNPGIQDGDGMGTVPDISKYYTSKYGYGPSPVQMGWKDTVRVRPGTSVKILVRFAPQTEKTTTPGRNYFSFDPTTGPYVWHCHLLEHEDNEMMRPYQLDY